MSYETFPHDLIQINMLMPHVPDNYFMLYPIPRLD